MTDRTDLLMVAAGLCDEPGAVVREVSDEHCDLLRVEAERMLRGGAVWSAAEWATLHAASRAALVEAGNAVRAEHAVQVGLSMSGRKARAHVYSAVDGGEALEDVVLDEVLDAARERLEAAS